jgi:hypothetical protein
MDSVGLTLAGIGSLLGELKKQMDVLERQLDAAIEQQGRIQDKTMRLQKFAGKGDRETKN